MKPHGFQSRLCFHFARENCPEFPPRVQFLHERFWANGFELDQAVENPEPFLAPLPSMVAVSSESDPLQRSSSCFRGHFSDLLKMVEGNVLGLYAFARMLITSPDLCFRTSFTLSSLVPPALYQTLD